MIESYLTDEEAERLENCASSTTTPQLWKADGKGEAVSISDIVRGRGMATGEDGKKYRPGKWTPVGLGEKVNSWKPTGNADDPEVSCACDKEEGCEKCS